MSNDSVLVIGSGAREHAIAWALKKSPLVGDVFCIPGNAGMSLFAIQAAIELSDHDAIARFIEEKKIRLTVIGPEAPLVAGLSDALRTRGHMVVGASQKAAQLEGSKSFAKSFMIKYGIPTAESRVFTSAAEARSFVRSTEGRKFRVLKTDGLAAGKGVIVAKGTEEIEQAISGVMEDKKFGEAGAKILLEETLEGPEVSVMALTDGKTVLPFPASQDHKRVFDDDQGPNTGGMGAYAPTPFYDNNTQVLVDRDVIQNFIRGVQAEGLDFRGIIYFGLMLTPAGPKVLEFNVRLGDPEAEAVIPLVKSDLYELFQAVAKGSLAEARLELIPNFACTVVMASGGYPEKFDTGFPIEGLDQAVNKKRTLVFHAGTRRSGVEFFTNGGRVLTVVGMGRTLEHATVRAYQAAKKIGFKNAHFRSDIGAKALQNKKLASRIKKMKRRLPENLLARA